MGDKELEEIRQQRLAQMESQFVSLIIFTFFRFSCFVFRARNSINDASFLLLL